MWKVVVAMGGLLVVFAVSPAVAQTDAGRASRATLTCEHADAPGRVRCEVEARVELGETITWGDVVLTGVPPFAAPLRGRIGPDDTTARSNDQWRWAFALVARGLGSGDVAARVRLVVCAGKTCTPRQMEVTGRVQVGE